MRVWEKKKKKGKGWLYQERVNDGAGERVSVARGDEIKQRLGLFGLGRQQTAGHRFGDDRGPGARSGSRLRRIDERERLQSGARVRGVGLKEAVKHVRLRGQRTSAQGSKANNTIRARLEGRSYRTGEERGGPKTTTPARVAVRYYTSLSVRGGGSVGIVRRDAHTKQAAGAFLAGPEIHLQISNFKFFLQVRKVTRRGQTQRNQAVMENP